LRSSLPPRARRTVGILVAAAGWSVGARAQAGGVVDLSWTAPPSCPGQQAVEQAIARGLPEGARVRARGSVEPTPTGFHLALRVDSARGQGERVIDAPTCDELATSAAVVVAMSIAEDAGNAGADEPPAAAAPAPPLRSSPSARPDRDRDDERPRTPVPTLAVRAQGMAEIGLLPGAALGGGLALGVAPTTLPLHVEIGAQAWASQDGTVATAPTRGARFDVIGGSARACWGVTSKVVLAPCLGVSVLRMSATGFGATSTTDASALIAGPEASMTVLLPLAGPLHARAGIDAFVPVSRQAFTIVAAGTVHRPDAISLRAWLGPEVRF